MKNMIVTARIKTDINTKGKVYMKNSLQNKFTTIPAVNLTLSSQQKLAFSTLIVSKVVIWLAFFSSNNSDYYDRRNHFGYHKRSLIWQHSSCRSEKRMSFDQPQVIQLKLKVQECAGRTQGTSQYTFKTVGYLGKNCCSSWLQHDDMSNTEPCLASIFNKTIFNKKQTKRKWITGKSFGVHAWEILVNQLNVSLFRKLCMEYMYRGYM